MRQQGVLVVDVGLGVWLWNLLWFLTGEGRWEAWKKREKHDVGNIFLPHITWCLF